MFARATLALKRRNDIFAIGNNRLGLFDGKTVDNKRQTKSTVVDGDVVKTIVLHEFLHVWIMPVGATSWPLNGNIS